MNNAETEFKTGTRLQTASGFTWGQISVLKADSLLKDEKRTVYL